MELIFCQIWTWAQPISARTGLKFGLFAGFERGLKFEVRLTKVLSKTILNLWYDQSLFCSMFVNLNGIEQY